MRNNKKQMTPIAVYGTLLDGEWNSFLWRGRARSESCIIHDCALVTVNGHFPYGVVTPDSQTVGELIWPEAHHYEAVLQRLDMLEGVPTHYDRRLVRTTTKDGEVWAWAYVVDDLWTNNYVVIPNNDWRSFVAKESTIR